MAHTLILGKTGSGKTTLAKKIAKDLRAKGIPILVLDPSPGKSSWDADFVTDDPDLFVQTVMANTRCAFFVDESGDMIGRYGKEKNMLATRTRHLGHSGFFIVQDYTGLDRVIREQCRDVYVFKVGWKRSNEIAENWVDQTFKECHSLNTGECIIKIGNNPAYKINVFS